MPKPKVISIFKTDRFEHRFLNISVIGRPVDLFVKCRSCELEIPVKGKDKKDLDIFEETVLRMIDIKRCSAEELADILCLKGDFVSFILTRLTEKGMLENDRILSEEGRMKLDQQMKERRETQYNQGRIFIVEKTGLILPYVHIGEFRSERVEEFNRSSITLGFGSAGDHHTVKGKCLGNSGYGQQTGRIPDTRAAKKTIRTFNKLAAARNMSEIELSEGYHILVSAGEDVYVHLQAVLQEGNVGEILFSDGFVSNVDGMLEYVGQEYPQMLADIRKQAIEMTVAVNGDEERIYKPQKCQEICQLYENACRYMADMGDEKPTVDERRKINTEKKQIIIDCYYMIEWGFYYYIRKNPLSQPMMNLFKKRSFTENAGTLIQFANQMGIGYARKCGNLFSHMDGRKIRNVLEHASPKLYVCLPLAVAEAKENSDSEIHSLIQKDRGFLRFINYLNENCGDLRHDTEADAMEMDAKEILRETKKILTIILPELDMGEGRQADIQSDHVSKARLLAQVSLEKRLGSICFAAMPAGLKDEWIRISPDKTGSKLPDSREYVGILYRILQTELAEANGELEGKDRLSRTDALDRLGQRYKGKIPRSFARVRDGYYSHSVRGEKSTLGAEALVYIANVEEALIGKLNAARYVEVIDQVISLRGHGDKIILNENEQSLSRLRDRVIRLTKIIGGYYD